MKQRLAFTADLVLAGGFAALGVWEALDQPDTPGAPPWTAPIAAVIGIGLVWRRAYPRAVLLMVAALGLAPHVLAGVEPAFYGFLLPFLVAAYTVAANMESRRSLIVPAAGAGVFLGLTSRGHEFRSVNQTAIIVLTIGAAYAVGRVTRLARLRGENAVALADLLRREQDLRAREAIAAERERLARELHDAIAHEVSVMVIQAGAAQRLLDDDIEAVRASLVAVEQAGRHTIEELYLMLGLLRDDELTDVPPGLGRLPGLVERVRASGLSVELTMSAETADVPAPVSLCAYRVVQESLTNVLKHTRDARADVSVSFRDASLRVDVRDDGGSGRPESMPAGSGGGLAGLRDRVRALGGAFSAGPRPDGGFVVGVTLPMACSL